MEIAPTGSKNSTRDISQVVSTKDLGHRKSSELIDFEDTSFLLRCSNHFPPKRLQSITR